MTKKRKSKIYRPHLSDASDARAVRTRASLRRALLELLEGKALESVTIHEICAAAGIGYTTFFRHYLTKESLLEDLAAEEIRRLVTLTLPVMDAKSALAASRMLLWYVDEHRSLWSTLLTGGAGPALRRELLRLAEEISASRVDPRAWPPAKFATRLLVSGTIEVLTVWLMQDEPLSIDEVAEIHHRVVIEPAMARWERKGRSTLRGAESAPARKQR